MNILALYAPSTLKFIHMLEKQYSQRFGLLRVNILNPFNYMILKGIFWISLGLLPNPLAANTGLDAFTVANIKVDVTADTASDARKKALKVGEKKAFDKLFRRLTRRIDHKRLLELEVNEIAEFVQDFGIENEKNSEVRYLADLTYRFKPHEVRNFLRNNNIEFAETFSKPILILPVFQMAGAVSLWDEPNPWRESFLSLFATRADNNQPYILGLVPMVFGKGDLRDIALISAELAVKADLQRLNDIARRYNVKTSAVALAVLRSTDQGLQVLDVTVTRYVGEHGRILFKTQIEAKKHEGLRHLLSRSATIVVSQIEDYWKKKNLLKFESEGVIAAVLPIKTLKEWVNAKKLLAKVAVINRIDLILLSRSEVRLNIHFIGDDKQLKLALAQVDMDLTEEHGSWFVKYQNSTMGHDIGKK